MPRGRKKLTEEEKQKIREGREKALKEKEKQKVSFYISPYQIESYEYGYKVFKKNEENKSKFYTDLTYVFKFLLRERIAKSGVKKIEELYEAIKTAEKEILTSLEEVKSKL